MFFFFLKKFDPFKFYNCCFNDASNRHFRYIAVTSPLSVQNTLRVAVKTEYTDNETVNMIARRHTGKDYTLVASTYGGRGMLMYGSDDYFKSCGHRMPALFADVT